MQNTFITSPKPVDKSKLFYSYSMAFKKNINNLKTVPDIIRFSTTDELRRAIKNSIIGKCREAVDVMIIFR